MLKLSKITATLLDCAVKGVRVAVEREDGAGRGGFRALERAEEIKIRIKSKIKRGFDRGGVCGEEAFLQMVLG
jgi:hypothetical protein